MQCFAVIMLLYVDTIPAVPTYKLKDCTSRVLAVYFQVTFSLLVYVVGEEIQEKVIDGCSTKTV